MNKWWSFPHKNPTEMKPPAEFFPRLGDDIKWGWIWILILGNARKGHYLAFSIASRMLWMNEPSHTSSVAAFIPKVGIFQSDSYCRLHCNRLDEAHTLNWRYVVHLGNHIFHWARWVKGNMNSQQRQIHSLCWKILRILDEMGLGYFAALRCVDERGRCWRDFSVKNELLSRESFENCTLRSYVAQRSSGTLHYIFYWSPTSIYCRWITFLGEPQNFCANFASLNTHCPIDTWSFSLVEHHQFMFCLLQINQTHLARPFSRSEKQYHLINQVPYLCLQGVIISPFQPLDHCWGIP